jgi:hypothetical protein
MTFVFVSFFALAGSKLSDSKDQEAFLLAQEASMIVKEQIEIAMAVGSGYASSFIIPQTIKGEEYSIEIIDNRELVVIYQGYEHVEILPVNVSGSLQFGANTLSKDNKGLLSFN